MPSQRPPRNAFENAVFGVGLLLVLALVAALAWQAVQKPGVGPALEVSVGVPAHGVAAVTVRNTGGRVAEAVRVEVCQGASCREAEIPYVPAGATREAFVGVAGAGQPTARVVSLLAP